MRKWFLLKNDRAHRTKLWRALDFFCFEREGRGGGDGKSRDKCI